MRAMERRRERERNGRGRGDREQVKEHLRGMLNCFGEMFLRVGWSVQIALGMGGGDERIRLLLKEFLDSANNEIISFLKVSCVCVCVRVCVEVIVYVYVCDFVFITDLC